MPTPKLRFKEFNGDWTNKKIGDIAAKVGSGSTPRGGAEAYTDTGIIFIRSQNVNNDRLLLDDTVYIPESTHLKMSGSKVVANDILLNITGASIGRSCVVPSDFTEANVNQHVCIIRTPNDDPVFVQSFLSSENGQNSIQSKQAGGGREGLNFQAIRSIDFHFPPSKQEQTKIASFLSAVDEKINQLTQKQELLSQYKQGMMQKLFSQQLRFKADDGSEFGEWEEKALKTIARIYDGTHQTPNYVEDGVPFYSVEHVTANNFSKTKFIAEDVFLDELKRVQLEKNDILLTRIGDIGTSKLIDWDVRASFYVSLALIKVDKNHNSSFVNQYIKSIFFQKELHERTIHVAFPKKINLGEIGLCLIRLPCLAEQTKIANFLSAIDQKIEVVAQQIEQAKTWKKGLLQQMFV
ncbi:restriction endonuclease subunit S [Acinetobacter indicus]|uniref:restriction endonuclease subunit S n=1 Tax=Acinetobacter indicus TaxID=756892 RepID=UPI0034D581E5